MIYAVSALTESTFAWEPVTPRGVASFARARMSGCCVSNPSWRWPPPDRGVGAGEWLFPDGDAAISQLADTGQIIHGELDVPDSSPQLLAEGHFLAFNIDGNIPARSVRRRFQFEFGSDSLLIFSLFGEAEIDYPSDIILFQRPVQPHRFAAEVGRVETGDSGLRRDRRFFWLLLSWGLLATVYFLPVWLVAFFANRDLNFLQSWRLAGAALMPGALLMSLSIWLYGVGVFDLVKLCFAFGMHFLIGWIYLFVSPLFLHRALPAPGKNPFIARNQRENQGSEPAEN